jgi:hypothetical protein
MRRMPRVFALPFLLLALLPNVAIAQEPQVPPVEEEKKPDPETEAKKAIYISGELGITRAMLGAVVNDLGFDETAANGPLYGLAGGLRYERCRFGVRWRVHDTTEFTLWTLALQAGYALPWRPISPIFSAHLGYVFDQTVQPGLFRSALPAGNVLPPNVDLRGAILGLDVNASYWVAKSVRVGAFIGIDAMYLHRSKAPPPQSIFGPTPELAGHPLYADSGNGLGLNVNLGLRGAFDIGLE